MCTYWLVYFKLLQFEFLSMTGWLKTNMFWRGSEFHFQGFKCNWPPLKFWIFVGVPSELLGPVLTRLVLMFIRSLEQWRHSFLQRRPALCTSTCSQQIFFSFMCMWNILYWVHLRFSKREIWVSAVNVTSYIQWIMKVQMFQLHICSLI